MHYFLFIIIINLIVFTNRANGEDYRIVGGIFGNIEDFPHQVSLEENGKHICGGSLIKPNVVLTAAHCVECLFNYYYCHYRNGKYSVRVGSSIKQVGGQVAKVVDICTHPMYNEKKTNYDYDVSVLKLNHSFKLGLNVQVIDLQPPGKEIPIGTMGTVTGWGRLTFKGIAPNHLYKAEVPKATNELCLNNNKVFKVTDRMTCYGTKEGGKDSCQMDSGGPLVIQNVQVGIVSWGYLCAVPEYPGVYTRIENKDIRNHIDNCLSRFN